MGEEEEVEEEDLGLKENKWGSREADWKIKKKCTRLKKYL